MGAYARASIIPRPARTVAPAVAAIGIGLLLLAATHKFGDVGLLAPVALAAGLVLASQPTAATFLGVALVILCEQEDPLFLSWTSEPYRDIAKGVTPIDLVFIAAVAGVAFRLLQQRRQPQLPPRVLGVPMLLTAAALAAGAVVGHAGGVGFKEVLFVSHGFGYLLVAPLLIINLDLSADALRRILIGVLAIAVFKALVGVAAIATGNAVSLSIESTTLTYLEPTANWVTMVALLWIVAVWLRPGRPPLWLLTAAPILAASLILSYRRSFWIGFVVAFVVLIALGLSPTGRRALVPTAALLALTIWLVGSFAIPGDSPVAKRAVSLQPTAVTASAEDRYRIDERANVWANIREHPVTGLGLGIPWEATARPMPLDLPRNYAHFAALYWWMKLGILGLVAYVAMIASGIAMSWQVWRRGAGSYVRAAGLASLGAIIGLIPIEMTATFTGSTLRFSALFGVQLGILAVLSTRLRQRA